MSNQRKIDDHSFWAGGSKGQLPMGSKMKDIPDQEGAGAMMDYPDTQEKVKRDQEKGVSQIKKHAQKPGSRN